MCCLVILFAVEDSGRTMGMGCLIVQLGGLLMTFIMRSVAMMIGHVEFSLVRALL